MHLTPRVLAETISPSVLVILVLEALVMWLVSNVSCLCYFIYLSILLLHLSIQSIHLSIQSIHLYLHLSLYLFIYLSIYKYLHHCFANLKKSCYSLSILIKHPIFSLFTYILYYIFIIYLFYLLHVSLSNYYSYLLSNRFIVKMYIEITTSILPFNDIFRLLATFFC